MENKALEIVFNYCSQNIYEDTTIYDLFIVWSCYILGNRKYLIGNKFSNHYFEVTYNFTTKDWYLDVYNKVDNIVIQNG